MRKLDIGCGSTKEAGYVGMDIMPIPGVDVVHSFDDFPYPFEDSSFDEVKCMSSLEHVADLLRTVEEIHRILKPGGILRIWVPHYSGPDAYRDPTHRGFFSFYTFDRFTSGGSYESNHTGMFKMNRRSFGLPSGGSKLKALPKKILNRFPDAYETFFCWMMPTKTMYYEMEAVK